MTRLTTRIAVGIVAAAACATTLTGCLGQPSGGADGKTSLVAVNNGEIQRITGAQNAGSQIAMAICEPLTGIADDGSIFMRGAESVESKDQITWTVKVAKGHTFSDGTKIDASRTARRSTRRPTPTRSTSSRTAPTRCRPTSHTSRSRGMTS